MKGIHGDALLAAISITDAHHEDAKSMKVRMANALLATIAVTTARHEEAKSMKCSSRSIFFTHFTASWQKLFWPRSRSQGLAMKKRRASGVCEIDFLHALHRFMATLFWPRSRSRRARHEDTKSMKFIEIELLHVLHCFMAKLF